MEVALFQSRWSRVALVALVAGIGLHTAPAHGDDEPLFEQLKASTRSEAFTVGALVQVVGTYTDPPAELENGFVLANVRLSFKGNLDRRWNYFIQTSFLSSPAVLDAALGFKAKPLLGLRFGAFKAPFSAEFLTSAASIDFVNRSQIVTALAPGRQIGLQLSGTAASGFGYAVSAYNGNGLTLVNDNNDLMTVARLFYKRGNTDNSRQLQGAVHVYHSIDENAPIGFRITGGSVLQNFTGERLAAGTDVRLTVSDWFAAAEAIGSRFDPRGSSRVEPFGYHVTTGLMVRPSTQLLARWDSIRFDGVADDSDVLVLGANHWPSAPTEVQLNVGFPTTGPRNIEVLANVQVAF
jgi:hypothetical protein